MRARPAGWGRVARMLHWTLAALILFQLGVGVRMTWFTPDLARQFDLIQLHKGWGTVIFALVLVRLAWRLAVGAPAVEGPLWRRRLAGATQALLYALMLWMPLSGWVDVSASPLQDLLQMRNMVFGLFPLPDPWTPGDERLSGIAAAAHLGGAAAMAGLIALHAAGALHGEFRERDRTLRRMILGR